VAIYGAVMKMVNIWGLKPWSCRFDPCQPHIGGYVRYVSQHRNISTRFWRSRQA
jgi:hypothetical protein